VLGTRGVEEKMIQHEPLTKQHVQSLWSDCTTSRLLVYREVDVLSAIEGLKDEQRQMFECKDDYDDLEGFLSDLSRLPDKWFPFAQNEEKGVLKK
jgi:hypothetical protein